MKTDFHTCWLIIGIICLLLLPCVPLINGDNNLSSPRSVSYASASQKPNPYGFNYIEVHTQEKYGTKDNPQFRPLPNVSLVLWTCGWFIRLPVDLIDFLRWRNDEGPPPSWFTGSTDENGYLVIPHVYLGNYRLFASKEGFVDISSKRHWGVLISMGGAPNEATCTLTAEGGPWDSQSCQQSSPSEEPLGEYPDFPKNKMFMVGHYMTVDEQESKGISRDLYITCDTGDISVFVAKWLKSGYSSWVFARHFSKEYTHFLAPEFFGICRDGQIFGITFGDLYYS